MPPNGTEFRSAVIKPSRFAEGAKVLCIQIIFFAVAVEIVHKSAV